MCFALGLTVLLTGCSEDEEEPVKTFGKVSGLVQGDLNENAPGLEIVSGKTVIARVNPVDYSNNPDFSVAYEEVIYSTVTDNAGRYAFDIEAYSTCLLYTSPSPRDA